MLIRLLEVTPFGFVAEVSNDLPYESGLEFSLFLNGEEYGVYRTNVFSVFSLKPNTRYSGSLVAGDIVIPIQVRTQELDFLINVKDYNANGDGISDETAAINTAIYAAPKGSVVYFPKGTYLTSHILLKSFLDIYIEDGATIVQNTNRSSLGVIKGFQKSYDHTDVRVNASWEGSPLDTFCPLVFGLEVEHVRIYGQGTLNGQGEEGKWWVNPRDKKIAYRSKNIFLNRCNHVAIMGITSCNSASWNTHPLYSTNLRFYDMYLKSPHDSANTDGINPESSKDVEIVGCRFEVGDDCIAVKSGKYYMSRYKLQPTENLTIRNCYMGDGHGGIAIGSEISCGVRNLNVSQCYMKGTDRGIRIKTRRGRGKDSVLSGIRLSNIVMDEVQHGISINMFYYCDPDGKTLYVRDKAVKERDNMTPSVRDIEISNVYSGGIRGLGVFMYGLPESKIEGVSIRGCTFAFADEDKRVTTELPEMLEEFESVKDLGIFIKNANNVTMEDNTFIGTYVIDVEENEA